MTYTTTYSTTPQNIPAPERKPVAPQMTMAEMAAQEVERTKVLFGCQSANWKARRSTTLREQVMRIIDLLRECPMTTQEIAKCIGVKRATVNSYLADARASGFKFSTDRATHKVTLISEPDSLPDVPKPEPKKRRPNGSYTKAREVVDLLSRTPMTTDEIAEHFSDGAKKVKRSTASNYIFCARELGYIIERDTVTGKYSSRGLDQ